LATDQEAELRRRVCLSRFRFERLWRLSGRGNHWRTSDEHKEWLTLHHLHAFLLFWNKEYLIFSAKASHIFPHIGRGIKVDSSKGFGKIGETALSISFESFVPTFTL
jgi:hypothetical protein